MRGGTGFSVQKFSILALTSCRTLRYSEVSLYMYNMACSTSCVTVLPPVYPPPPSLPPSIRYLLEQMDMKDKPIDEALRDFQILFRMPVSKGERLASVSRRL